LDRLDKLRKTRVAGQIARKQLTGRFFWILKLFGGLKPGVYRVEAALTGWDEEKFTERSELARIGRPFTVGEVPDSIRTTLTPSAK